MNHYKRDLEEFNIRGKDYPRYSNPGDFGKKFKRCSIYEYGNIGYSNSTKSDTPKDKRQNA